MKRNIVYATFSLFMLTVFATSAYPQWVPTNWIESSSYFNLHCSQDKVFVQTWDARNGGRMFLSADNGVTWSQSSSAQIDIDILSIVMLNTDLLAGTWNGFYKSTTGGTSWNTVTPNGIPADSAIWSLSMINTTLFASTRGAVYKSSDNGTTWNQIKTGIPVNARITSIIAGGNAIFAASDSNGVFITTNGGTNWTATNSGLTDKHIIQLAWMGTKLFAVTLKGVFISDNNGASWVVNSSYPEDINCLTVVGGQLLAGTDSSGIFLSEDDGATWLPVCSTMPAGTRVWSIAASSSDIFAGTSAGVWRTPINPSGIYFTITTGASSGGTITPNSDIRVNEGCSRAFTITPANGYRISSVAVDGNSAGTVSSYIFTNVTEDHSIYAAFESVPFTITASAGSGGSISPSGTTMVPAGSSQTYTIIPASGYLIGNVFIDGVSTGAVSTYTFSSVYASHTISAIFTLPTVYQINCGGSVSSPYTADQYYSGGTTYSVTSAITTTGITNPASQSVYQTERYGAVTYTFPNLTVGAQYNVRLHFAELYQTAAGKRKFNVTINGTTVLSNYDIYAVTGARYKAVVREFPTAPNVSGQIVIGFVNVTDNAKISGIEIVRLTTNNAPSIATAASATPNSVIASTTALSVLGNDDNGESNLTYTWAITGTAPAVVTFSANGTNAAKNTTVTFTKAGSYTFQATVADAGGLTAVSSVSVTVKQTLTSINIVPASATVATLAAQQFTATARDQFATGLSTQPAFTWSGSDGGSISSTGLFTAGSTAGGPYTVTVVSGGVSSTANVTVTAVATTVYQINCGGSVSSPYTADQYYSGGTARTVTNTITTAGVTNPAPQAVYKAERYGAVTYTLPSLTANASYTVRLHFAETYWTASGKRKFNVSINGTTVLSNYDIYSATGAQYKAVVREFTATASASGQIVIKLTNVTDNATIEGIQIIKK